MRTELYEKYKNEHPEEMFEIGEVKAYTKHVEANREAIRGQKVSLIQWWRDHLAEEGE